MEITQRIKDHTYQIIGVCMKVHTGLGPGFPEDYYQRALEYELADQGIPFEPQKPVGVYYREQLVGQNYLDFVIHESAVLEIKSVRYLDDVHRAQVIRYLTATGLNLQSSPTSVRQACSMKGCCLQGRFRNSGGRREKNRRTDS